VMQQGLDELTQGRRPLRGRRAQKESD
jgi:hypothetical protein